MKYALEKGDTFDEPLRKDNSNHFAENGPRKQGNK